MRIDNLPYKPKDLVKMMTKKGFGHNTGTHNVLRFYYQGKKTSISTHYSSHHAIISETNFGLMAEQIKLTRNEYEKLIECTLNQEQYTQLLIERGFLISN